MANQKFTSIKNDYCIVFDQNSEITECSNDTQIKAQGFSFTTIEEINELEQQRTVDAVGIITDVGQLGSVNIKATGGTKEKKNV